LIAELDVLSYAELQDRLGELIHGQEWPTIRRYQTNGLLWPEEEKRQETGTRGAGERV